MDIVISVASKNYSGPEDVNLMLTCDDNVTPFLVELSVKKQSARLTCIVGCCVVKSIGIGPGGTIKLKNGSQHLNDLYCHSFRTIGNIVEFGETDCCVEMQFIVQLDER